MFTLGNKEAIINSNSKFPVTVTAPTGSNSLLTIKGFGAFENTHIVSAFAQRFIPSRNASLTITAPDASALGLAAGSINNSIIVHIRVNTVRYTSEWANDFIRRGRPFIFEILVHGGETPTIIMNRLVEAFGWYESLYNASDRGLPFTYSIPVDGTIILTLKDPYLTFQTFVDFLPGGLTYGVKAVTSKLIDTGITVTPAVSSSTTITVSSTNGLLVGDTVSADGNTMIIVDIIDATSFTVQSAVSITNTSILYLESCPQEPIYDGKYLEENVRFSNYIVTDAYAISPDEDPKVTSPYTTISFQTTYNNDGGLDNVYKPHAFLGLTRGEVGKPHKMVITLYFKEDSDMFGTGGKVDAVLAFLLAAAPSTTVMTLANGNVVTTVADFLANTY